MAYNSANHLRKVIAIQNITLEHKEKGCTQEWIYKKLIFPVYSISRRTYYKYLGMNAKAMIKKSTADIVSRQNSES